MEKAVRSKSAGGISGDQLHSGATEGTRSESSLLAEIGQLWASYAQHGVAVRFSIGHLLNVHLPGHPSGRQPYGVGVVRKVAEMLDIDRSEVNRMRQFARMFTSVASFQELHPGVTSWTAVRQLLVLKTSEERPKAAVKPNQEAERPSGEASKPAGGEICPHLAQGSDEAPRAEKAVETMETDDLLSKAIARVEEAATILSGITVDGSNGLGQELRKALRRLSKAGRRALRSRVQGDPPKPARKSRSRRVVDRITATHDMMESLLDPLK